MNTHRRIATTIIITSFGLLLAACGGGSNKSMMDTDTGMTGDTDTGTPPVHVPTLAEVYSSDTATDRSFSAVSASVIRNYTTDTTSLPDDMELSVSSVQRNTGGGYDITYRIDDTENTVQFLPEHCDEVEQYCEIEGHGFWSMLTPVPGGGQLDSSTDVEYFTVGHLNTNVTTSDESNIQQRQMFVFGVETPAAAVPTQGEAVYAGWMYAYSYRQNTSSFDTRQRYTGSMQIVANFDMSSLNGRILSVRNTQPGEPNSSLQSRPTSSFSITNGQINSDGQFTATLTGLDSDPSVSFNESARGFMGEIVGRFFGPNADELGGAVSASRDVTGTDDDLNLYGHITSRQFGPSKTLGSAGFLAGTLRDLTAETSELREDDGMATVERTENGWRVAVGGRTVEFRDDPDLGSNSQVSYTYVRAISGGEAWFWSYTDGFWATPEFDHFDVKGWSFSEQDSQGNYIDISTYEHIVHGDRTPDSAMPTSGTATYDGRMEARSFPSDDAVFTSSSLHSGYRGDVTLTADFANAGVAGEITSLESRIGNGSYSSATGGVTFDADINGNGITADNLTGTGALAGYQNGNVRGAFFGPSAEEAAGVFDAQDQTANRVLTGWFGTAKDE